MENYIRIGFRDINQEQSEILIAILSFLGYDGFEESEGILDAYILESGYNASIIKESLSHLGLDFTEERIKPENWNRVWEENFEPVLISGFVQIRASFHIPVSDVPFDIVINPKMSFGTGHHFTTIMMMEAMKKIDIRGKSVLDFGTGTGILAILAEKMGASVVTAIDNDEWSIENAKENVLINNCTRIKIINQSNPVTDLKYDIILANINKNVILESLADLQKQSKKGTVVIFSGILDSDKQDLIDKTSTFHMILIDEIVKNHWISLVFKL